MEDSLIIAYDSCPPDFQTLIVARKYGHDMAILNKIQGDAAFGIYHYLTGGAELINEKDIPKKVVCDGDDESDHVYCPHCKHCIGSNDFVYDDFYYRDWKPMHCIECGQSMIWK